MRKVRLGGRAKFVNKNKCFVNVLFLVCSGRGQGGLNLPLPVPFNPGSRPVFFGSCPFAFFRSRNIVQCCIIFPFSPASRHLGNPASRTLFSRLPYTSRPLFSGLPPPCPPPHFVRLYAIFSLPVLCRWDFY